VKHPLYVYVIEATETGRGSRLRRIFYVGLSERTPEQVYRAMNRCTRQCTSCHCRHRTPGGASLRLRYELFAQYNPIVTTRREAHAIERWVAQTLRRRGMHVRSL
jgi:hypothetical protein